ncbi:hypothetical protein K431DRAFT_232342 [Polychaeton citri CBS 116435]|uniref:ASST-domain-containing protein n=1 Tax=Polychaeton citri CBS 116435 TaxID=1314669 RepID=A0A9P4Q1L8_9PEZI|nr:hypothetical protein K431DRAFT_232342 [Polychaeton citri CBS 116435]
MPTSVFMTRPQSKAPFLNVTVQNDFSPGYVFIGPYQHPGAGAYIYDKFGNLVWDGFGVVGSANAHDFKVCQYQGAPHLCVSQMNQQDGYGVGQGMIIDSNYTVVTTVNTGRNMMPADMHELNLVDGGTHALMTSYNTIPYDMTPFGIDQGIGWLSEGAFQEVDVDTGDVLFEWYSSNHVDPTESLLKPKGSDISGDGLTPATGFDYFHINAIDKSPTTGNYMVSARHTSSIYYINATDQSIIWALSTWNPRSDFATGGFNFTWQHDARFISENDTNTIISIFDNASNGANQSAKQSSAMIINIDHGAKRASLMQQVRANFIPQGIMSASQGNTQILSNGNFFIGWGSRAWLSEHSPDGDTVFAAHYADPLIAGGAMNYRAFSFEWESTPANTVPAVYSYALDQDSANRIYVSWNGATTVGIWRFYAASNVGDSFVPIGTTAKDGFETVWVADTYYSWVMVEAVALDGSSLRNSSFQPTFVPSRQLSASCNQDQCPLINS